MIVRGSAERGIAVLWHGRGVGGGSWMVPLAESVARHGVMALAVDWDSEAVDGGRADLLTSVRDAGEIAQEHGRAPDSVAVAGWSLGGTAAAGLAVHAPRLGIGLAGVVLIAPGDGPRVTDPISGSPLPSTFPPGQDQCAVHLAYGLDDPLATPDLVSGLELRLRASGWATSLHELSTDHAGVVGTRFDERTEQYRPSSASHAVEARDEVAAIIAGVAAGA